MTALALKYANVAAEVEAETDQGELVAYASTFGNVDLQGDRVVRGAFRKSAKRIRDGQTIPLAWGHDLHGSPQNLVGEIHHAEEDSEGLLIRARFDLADAVAAKAWRLVKRGQIDHLSIGYRVPPHGQRRGRDGVNELLEVDLKEVSLVLEPANPRARVVSFKSEPDRPDLRARTRALEADLAAAGIQLPADPHALRARGERLAISTIDTEDLPPAPAPVDHDAEHELARILRAKSTALALDVVGDDIARHVSHKHADEYRRTRDEWASIARRAMEAA